MIYFLIAYGSTHAILGIVDRVEGGEEQLVRA